MKKRAKGRPMKARPLILASAEALFLEHGLDVNLDQIAVHAGTTRQTLYNHFPSKSDLLMEVFATLKERLQMPFGSCSDDSTPLSTLLPALGRLVQAHFYDETTVRFQRLLVVALVQMPDLLSAVQQRPTGVVRDALAAMLAARAKRGEVHVQHPEEAAKAFLGAVLGSMYPTVLMGGRMPEKDELERLNLEVCATFLSVWEAA
ncbi:TetR/AcrR family transcriptional regulator [Alloalcanivorax xenomutans]|uniref:TetR/AcrR family transcriptional regulator n=1 Tax=Alloalcanivorax xenomutans TaxID=1094342 RepID=UPI0006D5CBE3|nr:TetR/AcrR family transcriptional regulator [Alloalcanivorax xenomutans]WOA30723.1 TetR/AcrR family transcriptional regulator [Alloalcanivorax xenomutans]CUR46029.1 Transcriptional regulator, TetR family [Alloalcanivorax xenomutans]